MILREFIISVSQSLMKANKSSTKSPAAKLNCRVRQQEDIRFDNIDHKLIKGENTERRRCKYVINKNVVPPIKCNKKTNILCSKCQINLCCVIGRDCFTKHHKNI